MYVLVLIDKRRRGVFVVVNVVGRAQDVVGAGMNGNIGGPGQHHEALAGRQIIGVAKEPIRAGNERIVRLQRYEDCAIAALGHEIEAMVEELAKKRADRTSLLLNRVNWQGVEGNLANSTFGAVDVQL